MSGKKKDKLSDECKTCHKKLASYETFLINRFSKETQRYDKIDVYCEKHHPKKN